MRPGLFFSYSIPSLAPSSALRVWPAHEGGTCPFPSTLMRGRATGVDLRVLSLRCILPVASSLKGHASPTPPAPGVHPVCLSSIVSPARGTEWALGQWWLSAGRQAGLTHPLPQHINELTMKLSVEDVLTRAEALYRQLTACPVSPRPLPTAFPTLQG